MAGKRLLDAAGLFNAARNVAKQHVRIRSKQLDAWSKTSTVAKAAKEQTDRVTLTFQAANALARRFNEPPPDESGYTQSTQRAEDSNGEPIPRASTVGNKTGDSAIREGLKQDHHYNRSEENTTSDPVPKGDLRIRQEKPVRYPTPDGTIPPRDAPFDGPESSASNADITGQRQTEAPLKDPLRDEQGRHLGEHVAPGASQTATPQPEQKPNTELPSNQAGPEPEATPGDISIGVFHSPRVARKLGGKPADYKNLESDQSRSKFANEGNVEDVHELAADIAKDAESNQTTMDDNVSAESGGYQMRESRVPSSRFGRLWQYGGLATSMAFGAVGETFRRATGSSTSEGGSLMLSAGNMKTLVAKLSRMRGAALKLGQMMSFQDTKMLPQPIHEVLQRVQDNADYMPPSQRNDVLSSNLGSDWKSLFSSFDDIPIAAASIGQVHKAMLASSDTPVAVKIQYPGVATSISSDLSNLSVLLTASKLLPKGLFLDKTIENARHELAWECDYVREAECQMRFRSLLSDESDIFTVPAIISEASGSQVLTAELMHGTAVTKSSLHLTQEQRDWIGTNILRLCLRELTEFKFMQTDPNWTNFLFNASTSKLELLDFGAAREYPDKFVDPYVRTLVAAAANDGDTVAALSEQLGYLTGHESRAMRDAHVRSVLTLAEPFRETRSLEEVYDFRDQTVTDRVRAEIPTMVRERLSPPPEETYSLHRKLSGAFLLLARLGSRVKCREMFVNAVDEWKTRQGETSTAS